MCTGSPMKKCGRARDVDRPFTAVSTYTNGISRISDSVPYFPSFPLCRVTSTLFPPSLHSREGPTFARHSAVIAESKMEKHSIHSAEKTPLCPTAVHGLSCRTSGGEQYCSESPDFGVYQARVWDFVFPKKSIG